MNQLPADAARAYLATRGVPFKSRETFRKAAVPSGGAWPCGCQYWTKDGLDEWVASRPGRGAGGGRPRKDSTR